MKELSSNWDTLRKRTKLINSLTLQCLAPCFSTFPGVAFIHYLAAMWALLPFR